MSDRIAGYHDKIESIYNETGKAVIGQKEVINSVLTCILSNGNILLEGAPGLAKTLLIMTLAKTVRETKFQRIQFTPDLLPADILGISAYDPEKGFYTMKGPIFANFILADEINRAPPKVQSAMLSVMQEKIVTIGKDTFPLPSPFFVMATQNPLEQLGVYPLPEAQIDRFLFKIAVRYPKKEDERRIVDQNTMINEFESYDIQDVIVPQDVFDMQSVVREIYLAPEIKHYIVELINATRHPEEYGLEYGKYIDWGASPRASIAIFITAKAHAFLENRAYVLPEDVREVAHNVLRHRIILNYEGKAVELETDTIIDEILKSVAVL
ncbi:MAG: MoxR family ATPase [archaeon]|nr:MoxR family ATPase [archaeon]